jgi:nitrogen fixation protein FixH
MKAGMGWPIGIVLVLTGTVAGNLIMMRVANDDPSMAIEPDYYKKAVDFDSTMAQERRSNALGWTAVSTMDSLVHGRPTRLHVRLRDASGASVSGASVQVTALFNARANDLQSGTLQREGDSSYSVPLNIRYPGEWEVRVDAVRGSEHFKTTSRVVATPAAAPVGTAP